VHIEERTHFSANCIKIACFETRIALAGVTMTGVRDPHDRLALALDCADESRHVRSELVSAHADDDGELSRYVIGVHLFDDADEFFLGALVRNFDVEGIADAAAELEVGPVEVAGAFTHPDHVG